MIQAIETRYAGCRFRSRLEARWAVFFDALHIEWHYEPQGFMTDQRAYLPDFELPDLELYYEVKGAEPLPGYEARLGVLADGRDMRTVLAVGQIPRPDILWPGSCDGFRMEVYYPSTYRFVPGHRSSDFAWCRCPWCGATGIEWLGHADLIPDCGHREGRKGAFHPDILAAYEAARSARFEHGEVPRP